MNASGPFASRSIMVHLARGAVGAGSLVGIAAMPFSTAPIASLLLASGLVTLAIAAWRGCPMCWTIGLYHTVSGAILFGKKQHD